ncbi:phospholipase C/P1 nuclease family protein [Mucisphaera calidilacus]|uniref:S1/P1 Nuclease n=1 Tax=Mucisphaera calidilacus TaxID=2527982 RepID=A0A518BZL8_9BACT|nr:hypothetical protein [Mucisphaera calidilacus]QDU72418.1 hypothetical protein Pan265_22830 [Mucisphaera calidilacus]
MRRFLTALLVVLTLACPSAGWHSEGHLVITRLALTSLPEDVPAFFREATQAIAEGSVDPDLFKNRGIPHLTSAEAPEHYFHVEALPGLALPATRSEWLAYCQEHGIEVRDAGMLPYAIMEHTERLTIAFAEHRRRPDAETVRQRAIVYAGLLAHYTADLGMPLHCTEHYNGRKQPAGRSPRSGIHARVDALAGKVPGALLTADPLEAPFAAQNLPLALLRELRLSHRRVDWAYKLEAKFPGVGDRALDDPEVVRFSVDCVRHSAHVTASMYLTAWRNSETIRLPRWLEGSIPSQ